LKAYGGIYAYIHDLNLGPGRFTPKERVSHIRRVKVWSVTQNQPVLSK